MLFRLPRCCCSSDLNLHNEFHVKYLNFSGSSEFGKKLPYFAEFNLAQEEKSDHL